MGTSFCGVRFCKSINFEGLIFVIGAKLGVGWYLQKFVGIKFRASNLENHKNLSPPPQKCIAIRYTVYCTRCFYYQ